MPSFSKHYVFLTNFTIFATGIAISLYIYLGTFTRYMADDYCETAEFYGNHLLDTVFERYSEGTWRAANRYSNILFVGLSEMLGEHAMQITTAGMILLWGVGIVWSIHEVRKLFKINWNLNFDILLGMIFTFFSLLQAPHLFQTIYWRSAMMTHFAPLVFGSLLFAFIIRQIRHGQTNLPYLWIRFFVLVAAFVLAGFSEPPTATAITVLILVISAILYFVKSPLKQRSINLLAWVFAGTFIGLMVMILSPANADVAQERGVDIFQILKDSFFYAYLFILDSLKTQPLPIVISILIPLTVIVQYKHSQSDISDSQKRTIWIIIITIPFLLWLLIAASFSPSVYGQSFPIERARFLARAMMIASLMFMGGLFGLLMPKTQSAIWQWLSLTIILFASIVYPLRAAYYMFYEVPQYQERAELWDLRDAFIRRHASQGETDLIIPSFSGVEGIKELDDNPNHWINACAAQFYGVNSIRTVTVRENLIEVLSE